MQLNYKIMDKINYIKEVFKSCLEDLKSKKVMKKNGWYRHVPVGIVMGILIAFFTHITFKNGEALWFQYFVPIFTSFCICWGFERIQGMYANYMGKERAPQLDSDKDVLIGWIPSIISIIITLLFLIK